MTQVIEGLKVTVVGAEVADLAKKQATFHTERVAFYDSQLELYKNIEDQTGIRTTSHQDPREAAVQKQIEHQQKADHLNFVATHVKPNAEYLLDNAALATLGVLKGGRFYG